MAKSNAIVFQFLSEPSDVNFGGNVHGGVVMKWIDQTAYACARNWAENYCVTVYVGSIRFYKSINIGDIIKVEATVIYTGTTSIHIAVDVFARQIGATDFEKKTHCIIVFVAVDANKNPIPVQKWTPTTPSEKVMEQYALRLLQLRSSIEQEMKDFLS
jgi:acyl-CoA hydrolase